MFFIIFIIDTGKCIITDEAIMREYNSSIPFAQKNICSVRFLWLANDLLYIFNSTPECVVVLGKHLLGC